MEEKYPQKEIRVLFVDNVDKLFPQQGIAYFGNVSRPHGYQQVAVDTIIQKKIFNFVKGREIMDILP